jgi:hypothetical protein
VSALRRWHLAFACGLASSFLAGFVLPDGYSHYMHTPATPHDRVSLVRMHLADSILVAGFAVTLIAAGRLALAAWRRRRWSAVVYPLVVLMNPFQQPIFLEDLDTDLNYRWWARANAPSLMGQTEAEVQAQMGEPTVRVPWTDGGDTDMEWRYAPLPFYCFGSTGQVFFSKGRVRSFEPNDD